MLEAEINRLLNNDLESVRDIGKFISNRENKENGLTADELKQLLILMENAFDEVYDKGIENGRWMQEYGF